MVVSAVRDLLVCLVVGLWVGVAFGQSEVGETNAPLQLNKLSQLYLPYDFDEIQAKYCYGQGAAIASLYQHEEDYSIVYVLGRTQWLQLVDITDVTSPKNFHRQNINTAGTAIDRCNGLVVVSTLNFWNPSGLGNLLVYTEYNPEVDQMTWQFNLTVGPTPVDIAFTPDCSKLVVANQGFHGLDRGSFYNNPQGSISVIDFASLQEGELTPEQAQLLVTEVDFTKFDEDAEKLVEEGVRWVYRGDYTPDSIGEEFLSHDLEPTSLVMDSAGETVYVFMQKNNAVAILDLKKGEITSILPLGTKSFENSPLDPSSVDGGATLASYPIEGFYQPRMVVPINGSDGETYLISVNTGMETNMNKEVNGVFLPYQDWLNGTEMIDIVEDEKLVEELSDETKLGDLKFSAVDNGLVTFGGRSFSVWRLSDLEVVYDSGYLLEQRHKTHLLSAYNSVPADAFCATDKEYEHLAPTEEGIIQQIIEVNTEVLETKELVDDLEEELAIGPALEELLYETVIQEIYNGPNALIKGPRDFQDISSNSVGPEPNALAVGIVNNTRVLIVSTRGSSSLFLFEINDPLAPVWHSASHFGYMEGTYYDLYQTTSLGDVAPSSLTFVEAENSPTGEPLLLVTGEMSGTLSIYGFSHMQPPSFMLDGIAISDESELLTSESFPSIPLNQTQEVKGRASIQDLTQGICQDIVPGDKFTCVQQANFGKCKENFMIERNYCARTCKHLPCNQGGQVEAVMMVHNASILTVNPYMFPENVQETLERGILQGYQCVGRSSTEVCLETPAFFSGLAGPLPTNSDDDSPLSYIAISDRGPSQDCGELQRSGIVTPTAFGKGFPLPDFTPFISKVQFDPKQSQVVVEQTCYLKGTDGSLITGLSNRKVDGVPYSKDCQSPIDYNDSGIDSEDIYPLGNTGLCLAVEEYSPSIFVVDCDFANTESCGTVKMRYTPQGVNLNDASYPVSDTLPKVYTNRIIDRGFESVAVSPDGAIAYVFLQSPMCPESKCIESEESTVIRVLELDTTDPMDIQVVGEYLYMGDTPEMWTVKENSAMDVKVSAALWIGDSDSDDILVLERAEGQVKLYIVNFANATNVYDMEQSATLSWESMSNFWMDEFYVSFLTKTLLLDSSQVEGWDGETVTYKQEGVGLVNDCTVIFGADNEFGMGGTGPSTATVVRMQRCISEFLD